MNQNDFHRLHSQEVETLQRQSTMGMAVIDAEGHVCMTDPAIEMRIGASPNSLLGLDEAALLERLQRSGLNSERVVSTGDGMSAIHYVRSSGERPSEVRRLKLVAEMLREPLASIFGFTELLLTQDYPDETRRELLQTMLTEIEVMNNVINQELDISQEA